MSLSAASRMAWATGLVCLCVAAALVIASSAGADIAVPGATKEGRNNAPPTGGTARLDLSGLDLCAPGTSNVRAIPDTFDRRMRFYDGVDYRPLIETVWPVVKSRGVDNRAERELAAFWLAKGLFQMKLYLPALSCFRWHAEHPHSAFHEETLYWLFKIEQRAGPPAGTSELMAAYLPEALDAPANKAFDRAGTANQAGWNVIRRGGDPALALRWFLRMPENIHSPDTTFGELVVEASSSPSVRGGSSKLARVLRWAQAREPQVARFGAAFDSSYGARAVIAVADFGRCQYRKAREVLGIVRWQSGEPDPEARTAEMARELARELALVEKETPTSPAAADLYRQVKRDLELRRQRAPQDAAAVLVHTHQADSARQALWDIMDHAFRDAEAGTLDAEVRSLQQCSAPRPPAPRTR